MKQETIDTKKREVLEYLKLRGVSSKRNIQDHIRSNNDDTLQVLNQLLQENKVSVSKFKNYSFWSLKEYKQLPKNQTK
jgi:predicted HTH domain antitoxin